MTLEQIIERLERLEHLTAYCLRCDLPATDNPVLEGLAALRLELEREVFRRTTQEHA